ncbi:sigma-70 family RNA polymerase sigma factor [Humibacillus xanthopallidus]|uniref:sigma-70 family RNA polymerase sigma factor n=1 Tax=Humibacillus xanthopallidus TaxID=412689 RepID=UPI00384DDF6E
MDMAAPGRGQSGGEGSENGGGSTPTDRVVRDFEAHRARLRAVAYRVLGSTSDADDAVQEAWLRLGRTDASQVDNLGGWLTTVVARISLDMLRSRAARRETLWDGEHREVETESRVTSLHPGPTAAPDPAAEAELADAVGVALLLVLDSLTPAERLAFVLHDLFGLPFEQIAGIVDRSPAATRQLASRARRQVRSAQVQADADRSRQRRVVEAFLAASRAGDFAALLELLDPDVVMRADTTAAAMGAASVVRGRSEVAGVFNAGARAARLAVLGTDDGGALGQVGAVWAVRGEPKVAFAFTVVGERVAGIELIADPEWLTTTEITYLPEHRPGAAPAAEPVVGSEGG